MTGLEFLLQRKFHYGWVVVGVTFLTLLVGAGVRSTPGVLMVPFEQEFHWSRATISFAVAVSLVKKKMAGRRIGRSISWRRSS